MKKIFISVLLLITLFLVSCGDTTTETTNSTTSGITTEETTILPNTTTEITTVETTAEIEDVLGLESKEVIVNHYFNPFSDVLVTSSSGEDITKYLEVEGFVDYGVVGSYTLNYSLNYNDDSFSTTRTITVKEGTYQTESFSRPMGTNQTLLLGDGSYSTGSNYLIEHPVNPMNIASNLLDVAVPSSGWWTTLLVENYGGGNGIYTNPLRTAFSNEGLEITNPQDGFVQYWLNEYQTIAQFPIAIKDLYLKSTDLGAGYTTQVIDYSDYAVKVAMRNLSSSEDEVVVTLVQGSPYVFAETANKNALTITTENMANVEYYDLNGNLLDTTSHTGDGIVIKYVDRHSGYNTSPPANVISAQYSDKYYLVNTPKNSQFTINNNVLSMTLNNANYISVAAINDLTEIDYYHTHGYTMIQDTLVSYEIDYENSMVYTDYVGNPQFLDIDNANYPLQALMPHHYKYSDAVVSEFTYRTVRGTLKLMEGNYFQTALSFNGLVPGYTLPDNLAFSSSDTVRYLESLDNDTQTNDFDNFYNDEGPYWNSKALYPLAQGIIIADQLGENNIAASLIGKLRSLLADWYTYSGSSDNRYLYYNNPWGSVYYSNNDFGTATGLSDHSFTHGYLIYASSVLAMYDPSFVSDYGLMVDLLLDDYMETSRTDSNFEYLRNFDPWAGHSWAHGFGNFAEGNNLESTSEALNSWNGGYLWALATNDTERMEAAIYGFVTEITSIKEYWFDWDDQNWDPAYGDYVDVAGIVWGGKHDYATWFGANPTFIYGIQWLPSGEYLTNYALSDYDYNKLSSIFSTYLEAKDGIIDTWYSNMWSIQAIIDSDTALSMFDETKILNDDYPSELVGAYWMIHALDSLGRRTDDYWMKLDMGVTSTIYMDEESSVYALIWNVSNASKTVEFYDSDGLVNQITVDSKSFTKVEIN
ncbi:glycosyl hydrolase [Candidatus Izemoplasma sp. B36]|uniref:glycosyl hydrolase n=1 Tax=Candidatus Izemoplasma sp. B36 TaxID=3242468 RepID=UPI003556A6CF